MIPGFIAVVDKHALPFIDTGKIRKRELADLLTTMMGRRGRSDS